MSFGHFRDGDQGAEEGENNDAVAGEEDQRHKEQDLVSGSPQASVLSKRPYTEAALVSPAILTYPSSTPRPESSESSTISAPSSLPGRQQQQPPPSTETSPRKKPRKLQMPPSESNISESPESAIGKREREGRDRSEWDLILRKKRIRFDIKF